MESSSNKTRIALFGGAGFIGSHLVRGLYDSGGYDIVVLDVDRSRLRMLVGASGYRFVDCDIGRDADLVQQAVVDSDIVVDLVAYANPAVYITNPLEVIQLNLFDNLRIVDLCVRYNKRLVQFSTCEVYGKTGGSSEPFHEDRTDCILGPVCKHRWIYACAKQLLERIVHARGLRDELEYTIVRPFNFLGPLIDYLVASPGDGNPRVFSHFMSALLWNGTIKLVDGGGVKRCYTYIADAVDAILLILSSPAKTRNEIVNVGNPGNEASIRQLAYMMKSIYEEMTGRPCTVPIVDVAATDFYGRGHEDCDRRIPSVDKMRALGWTPEYDLRKTLELTMSFYVEHNKDLPGMPKAYRTLADGTDTP